MKLLQQLMMKTSRGSKTIKTERKKQMDNIIRIDFQKLRRKKEPRYTILVDPSREEFINCYFDESGEDIYIVCNRYEDIPRMKELADKKAKIQKAING